MQNIIIKFKAPKNKDLLIDYIENNQFFNGYIIMNINIDFIKDFEKNVYMDIVKMAADEKIKSVYYTSEGVLLLDFTLLINDIEYFNKLSNNGKELVNHKNKDKFENDGLCITQPDYYLKEKIIYGYELKYPNHLINNVKLVKIFLERIEKEKYYKKEKKETILNDIADELSFYDIKLVYNYESGIENNIEGNIIHIDDKLKLKEIIKNDWYYLINDISFNSISEIYYQKGRIVFDFRKLKSSLMFINLLVYEKDFLYEDGKPYLFRIIKNNPSDYIYLYFNDEYRLDEFEKEYEIDKKIKIFFEEYKKNIRYFEINDYKNSKESNKAYKLVEESLLKYKVNYKNVFRRKINFFISELMLPLIAIVFFVALLIYLILYLY
jgi:hypothetical protein